MTANKTQSPRRVFIYKKYRCDA